MVYMVTICTRFAPFYCLYCFKHTKTPTGGQDNTGPNLSFVQHDTFELSQNVYSLR